MYSNCIVGLYINLIRIQIYYWVVVLCLEQPCFSCSNMIHDSAPDTGAALSYIAEHVRTADLQGVSPSSQRKVDLTEYNIPPQSNITGYSSSSRPGCPRMHVCPFARNISLLILNWQLTLLTLRCRRLTWFPVGSRRCLLSELFYNNATNHWKAVGQMYRIGSYNSGHQFKLSAATASGTNTEQDTQC